MTTFDDKEKAAENKYAHGKEQEFKVHARAHKLLGLWVATKMGFTGPKAEEYATALVTDLNCGEQHLFHRIKTDLLAHDLHIADHDIKLEMYRLEQLAKEQLG